MILALLLSLPALDLGTRSAGEVQGRLSVTVHREGAGPGLARARLDIEITGPAAAETQTPRLEDALAAWHVARAGSSWAEGRVGHWLELEQDQAKPGAAPLPGVVLRVRPGPDADWSELKWLDPLHSLAAVAGVEVTPPPPLGPYWPWAVAVLAVALLAALPFLRRKPPPAPEVTPRERALAALASARSLDDAEAAVRHYLSERHAVPASRTPAEIEPEHPALGAVLRRCEAARFAGLPACPEDVEEALSLARATVAGEGESAQTAKAG